MPIGVVQRAYGAGGNRRNRGRGARQQRQQIIAGGKPRAMAKLAVAMRDVLDRLRRDYEADVGIVAVDSAGIAVVQHLTRDMPHAFFSGEADVVSRMRA